MMTTPRADWIHFGCGLCAPEEWTNFDSSPTLRLQRLPVIGPFMPSGRFGRFPRNVRYGDIVVGLPLPPAKAELLYCSHVLEHLSLADLRKALRNCRVLLRPGGTFRLVLPDLEALAKAYVEDQSPQAALRFMEHSLLGRNSRPRGVLPVFRDWLGNVHHLWMWDFKSLSQELANAGFEAIRRASFCDSHTTAFHKVEEQNRWTGALGIECRTAE